MGRRAIEVEKLQRLTFHYPIEGGGRKLEGALEMYGGNKEGGEEGGKERE